MAISLKPTLTLESTGGSTGVSEDASLSLSVTDTLTVTDPMIGISRVACTTTGNATIILPDLDTTRYVYIKNTDATNHIKLFTGASELFGIIWPGECSFFAIIDGEGLKAQANTGNCILEFGYWTKA